MKMAIQGLIIAPDQEQIERYSRHRLTEVPLRELRHPMNIEAFIDLTPLTEIFPLGYYWQNGGVRSNSSSSKIFIAAATCRKDNLPKFPKKRPSYLHDPGRFRRNKQVKGLCITVGANYHPVKGRQLDMIPVYVGE